MSITETVINAYISDIFCDVRFEGLMTVEVFQMSCGLVDMNWCFRETWYMYSYLSNRIASQHEITFTFYSILLYTLKKIHVHHSTFLVYIYSWFLRSLL